jgi:hypothetical protein
MDVPVIMSLSAESAQKQVPKRGKKGGYLVVS